MNRLRPIMLALFLSNLLAVVSFAASPDLSIWLDKPAKSFTESLPLGNGRLGAMDFGGIEDERIALNEDSLWSGSAQDADRTNAADALPEIRRLLLEGKNLEAERLVNRNFTCAGRGSGNGRSGNVPYGSYQVLGNLRLAFTYADTNAATGYRRELDLGTATGRTDFPLRRFVLQDGRRSYFERPPGRGDVGWCWNSAVLTEGAPSRVTCGLDRSRK